MSIFKRMKFFSADNQVFCPTLVTSKNNLFEFYIVECCLTSLYKYEDLNREPPDKNVTRSLQRKR
jgi:hypothetical protein